MKKYFIFFFAVIILVGCTKDLPPQELVGEWKNVDISYYYDDTKLEMEYYQGVDFPAYRAWIWENGLDDLPSEAHMDAELHPSYIVNADGSAVYGYSRIRVTYSDNVLTFRSSKGSKSFVVEGNSFKEEHNYYENVYAYALEREDEPKGYDGKGNHIVKQVITWVKQ